MRIAAGRLRDIQQLFQKEVKVSCCSLKNTASAKSRKHSVDSGYFSPLTDGMAAEHCRDRIHA